MKTDIKADPGKGDINADSKMGYENIIDILERINGLSFEGQRQIYAYLKTQIEKYEKKDERKKGRQGKP